MGSIKNVVSEPIEGHEDYHMMVTVRSRFRNRLWNVSGVPARDLIISSLCRLFSWVQQKLLSIGSTGCLHSLWMQSKTPSLENGSISNVPLFLMMDWD